MDIDVAQLKSLGELNKALNELEEYEVLKKLTPIISQNVLNSSIAKYTSRRDEINSQLKDLEVSLPSIPELKGCASSLSSIVGNAADIGNQLSGKVRQLDLAKTRVQDVECSIGNIIKLSECVEFTSNALGKGFINEAAVSISKFLEMDNRTLFLVEKIEKENVGISVLENLKSLHLQTIDKLCDIFDVAAAANDAALVQQHFRLFPLIKRSDIGLNKYGQFLATRIGAKADALLSTPENSTAYVDVMTELLEFVAQTIQSNESIIREHYGQDSVVRFIQIVQGECDRHAELIFMNFKEKHSIPVILQRVRHELSISNRSVSASNSAAAGGQQKPTPVHDYCLMNEALISDTALLNARIELYFNFLQRRLWSDVEHKEEKDHVVSAEIKGFLNQCQLSKISQEIIAAYLPLEQLFLQELVYKAILMDELDESSITFRLIDDVFFVVKKCLSRAISSGSVDAVCALFNHTDAVLTDQLIEDTLTARTKCCNSSGWIQQAYYLVHKRAGSGTFKSSLLGANNSEASSNLNAGVNSGTAVDTQTQYLVALNSLEACLNCLRILRETLERYIHEVFGLRCQSDLNKLQACLSDLVESLEGAIRNLLDTGYDQLRGVIRPQVTSLTQAFSSVKRELTEEEFEQYAVNDPWVESLIVGLQNLLKPFHVSLSAGNYEKLVSVLVDELLIRLERSVQQKNYNRYGALQFDKELRCLVNFFTSISSLPCRDKFARLLQISKLLNLEKVEEVSYYGDTSNWRLSANEIRRLLTLRVDFKAEEIRRIHL